MKYALLFAGTEKQTRPDNELIWAGLDWDIRVRTPAIVGLVSPTVAKAISSIKAVSSISDLISVSKVYNDLLQVLKDLDSSAQLESGWKKNNPNALKIVQMLCNGAWTGCKDSSHGLAWQCAYKLVGSSDLATIKAAEVSKLGRFAARALTWRTQGATTVKDIKSYSQTVVDSAFAGAIETIKATKQTFINSF